MRAPRFLVPDGLAVGQTVELPPACSHHALRVLRLRPHDALVLFDGRGSEYEAFLMPGARGAGPLRATIVRGAAVNREARLRITIVQALSAQDKMDWLIEKTVELGVDRIVLASAARSVVHLSGPRQQRRVERWHQLAAAACAQCGRNRLPRVELADDLAAALSAGAEASARWLLEPSAPSGLVAPAGARSVALAVGPEGGFDAREAALARSLGYVSARMGPRVLRTETAAVAAVCVLLALDGEFS